MFAAIARLAKDCPHLGAALDYDRRLTTLQALTGWPLEECREVARRWARIKGLDELAAVEHLNQITIATGRPPAELPAGERRRYGG